ncbi:MAG: C-terminal binding protein [Deltaproteobacteria bacterium]|nr:C-terminal binding protein [Deltaproteobacteria bacterium]
MSEHEQAQGDHQPWEVVITDCDHGYVTLEQDEMDRIGARLTLAQLKTEEEVIRVCAQADCLLSQYAPLTRAVLERLPKCKVIAKYGVGVDTIDLQAAADLGIIVANVPDYCSDEVADHAAGLFLALARKVAFFDRQVKSGQWDFRQGIPIPRLRGKTLGVIGYGRIGRRMARKMLVFGVRVIAYDPWAAADGGEVSFVELATLLREADFISLHCSLNETSRHMIGEQEFAAMERKPLLINVARGAVVDEEALIRALEEGRISGAGLDVLETEPPDPQNPMLKMGNVIFSPHAGFYSEESIRELKRHAAENVSAVLLGGWPRAVVNKEVIGRTRARIS